MATAVDTPVLPRGEQIFDRQLRSIGQFGQRVAELLERGDAGVVLVVVGPDLSGELLNELLAACSELLVIQPRVCRFEADELRFGHCGGPCAFVSGSHAQ